MCITFLVGCRKNIKGVIKMKKYEATIGSYLGIFETESGLCYQVNPKTKRVIEGFVFGNYIYDFKESKRYYIVQREKHGFLKDSEFGKVKTDIEYALEIREKVNKIQDKKENQKVIRIGKCIRR